MDADTELECPCFQAPPDFDVPPPPKPFMFMTVDDSILETLNDDDSGTCPSFLSDADTKAILESKQTLMQINEPLFALIMIASCMIFILIFGGFVVLWCRKRSRYAKDNFKSIPKANISIANDLRQSPVVNGKLFSMNGNSSKTLPAKTPNTTVGMYGCTDDVECKENSEPYVINYHSLGRQKQRVTFCETHNPIYEEISLCNVPSGISSKTRSRQLDYLNDSEIRNLLATDNDKEFHSTNYCLHCSKPFISNSMDGDILRSSNSFSPIDGGYCKCYPITLSETPEIYQTRFRSALREPEYHHKAALV